MIIRISLLLICSCLLTLKAFSTTYIAEKTTSTIQYTLTFFSVPFKNKKLPTTTNIIANKVVSDPDKLVLKKIETKTYFTSKNPIFRKVVDYDKYPYFTFESNIKDPIILEKDQEFILPGKLTFHGQAKDVNIQFKNFTEGSNLLLRGNYEIKMTEFGLTPPLILFKRVDNIINTKIEINEQI